MKLIPQSVSRSVSRSILQTKKNSPHIFFVAGIAGVITSTVLACRATLKLEKSLDEIKTDIDGVKQYADISQKNGGEYSEQQYYRDLGMAYGRSALKIGKMYGPTVIIGVASVGALTGSHVQLARRNAALTAAFGAISQAFEDYRERVREEIGEKKELEIYRAEEDAELVDENGKKHVVKVSNPTGISPYARFFDEYSTEWQHSPEYNRMFLHHQQNYANESLRANGHLFLNDVYRALGLEDTSLGAIVGWIHRTENGDGYVSFGLFEPESHRFINGLEPSILLDFNVDGIIYDLI